MLTFLRKIRRSLIDSGSGRNYLLYAIGEVLLVMIGILLALQVSNWNQLRQDRNLERTYLENFLLDLKTDSICLARNLEVLELEKKPGLQVLHRLLNTEKNCCRDSIRTAIRNSAYLGWAMNNERSKATLNEIVSSGNLRLITNQHLRVAIIEYYSFWDHAFDRQDERKSDYANLTYKLFSDDGDRDDAQWFYKTLDQNNAEITFRNEFRHEKRYGHFLDNVTLKLLFLRRQYLKSLIEMELAGEYDRESLVSPHDSWLE